MIDEVSSRVRMKDSVPRTPWAISLFPKTPLKGAMIISLFVLNKTSPSLNTFPIRIFSSSISLFLTLKFLFFFDRAVPNVSILSKKLDDWTTSTITPGGGYLENFF